MGDQNRAMESNSAVLLVDQRKRERESREISMAPNWSYDLPEDLIVSIAKRLSSLEDFTFFGAVCKSWRSATTKLIKEKQYRDTTGIVSRLLTNQVPLLMLPLTLDFNNPFLDYFTFGDKEVGFYNPGKGEIIRYKVDVPKGKMMCASSLGWLMFVPDDRRGNWTLFHPLTLAKIELPYVPTTVLQSRLIDTFVLSSSPSCTSDYICMFYTYNGLGFCRPGLGENWKTITEGVAGMTDVVYNNGRFYFLYLDGCVSVFDIDKEEPEVVAPSFSEKQLLGYKVLVVKGYLVESGGVLLVVLFTAHENSYEPVCGVAIGCRVFEVPFAEGKSWLDSEVKSLGKRTIFLSPLSSSVSIEASDYSRCKPNCIYFMNDFSGSAKDMGVYNMEDGIITRDFDSFFSLTPGVQKGNHLWIQPSL